MSIETTFIIALGPNKLGTTVELKRNKPKVN